MSSGWRTRKTGGIIYSKFEGLRIRASVSVLDWAQRPIVREVEKMDVSAQAERKKIASPFTFLFYLSPQWIRCLSSALVRVIFTQSADSSANLFWRYFHQFSSVQSLGRVRHFTTPWPTAHQASLSITNSWSLPKLMSIESAMASNYLILCCPLLLLPSIFPSIRVF